MNDANLDLAPGRKRAIRAVWHVVRDDREVTTWADSLAIVELVLAAVGYDRSCSCAVDDDEPAIR